MSLPKTYNALFVAPKAGEKPYVKKIPLPKPGKDEVLIKMEFAPINLVDIAIMHGAVPPGTTKSDLVGTEGSGTIAALGQDLQTRFKVGDKVHVQGPGTIGQYLVAKTEKVFLIQGNLPLEQAASHYINPITVYRIAMQAEEGKHKAVIHTAGTSAVGKMLVRLLKQKGIKSINVVRRDDFTEELKKDGADYVLNSKDPDFWTNLKEVISKEQATMAADAISGDFSGKLLSAMPPNSTLYVYGLLSGVFGVNDISIGDLFQGKMVTGLKGLDCLEGITSPEEIREFYKKLHSLLPTALRSDVQKIFKLEDFGEAIAYYNENSSKGRVLLRLNEAPKNVSVLSTLFGCMKARPGSKN